MKATLESRNIQVPGAKQLRNMVKYSNCYILTQKPRQPRLYTSNNIRNSCLKRDLPCKRKNQARESGYFSTVNSSCIDIQFNLYTFFLT